MANALIRFFAFLAAEFLSNGTVLGRTHKFFPTFLTETVPGAISFWPNISPKTQKPERDPMKNARVGESCRCFVRRRRCILFLANSKKMIEFSIFNFGSWSGVWYRYRVTGTVPVLCDTVPVPLVLIRLPTLTYRCTVLVSYRTVQLQSGCSPLCILVVVFTLRGQTDRGSPVTCLYVVRVTKKLYVDIRWARS